MWEWEEGVFFLLGFGCELISLWGMAEIRNENHCRAWGMQEGMAHIGRKMLNHGWRFQALSAVVLVWGVIAPAAAQAQVPEICRQNNGANILKCQKTCASACKDVKFRYKRVGGKLIYKEKCNQLLETPEAQRADAEGCTPPPPPPPEMNMSYRECLEKVENFFRDYKLPPPPDNSLKVYYTKKELPMCGVPIDKLKYTFECMQMEYSRISKEAGSLRAEGFGGIAGCKEASKYTDQQLKAFQDRAEKLVAAAKTLSGDFDGLDNCQKLITGWFDKVDKACEKVPWAGCKKMIADQRNLVSPTLRDISQQAKQIKTGLVQSLQDGREMLKNVNAMRIMCPRVRRCEVFGTCKQGTSGFGQMSD